VVGSRVSAAPALTVKLRGPSFPISIACQRL